MLNKRNLELLRLPTGIRGAPVCVVDSGFDIRTVPGIIEVGETKVDLHGTCVAWIIRELANPTGIHCFARGWSRLDEAVRYCVENDIHLINCSLSDARLSEESINLCLRHNILIVKSAGNEGSKGVTKPAEVDSAVMAVAAYDADRGAIERYSSRGPEVDIAAPTDWQIELHNGKVVPFSGTSGAAPVITAALSLYLSKCPWATIADMKNFIYENTTDIGDPGRDIESGHGIFVWPANEEVEPVNWQYIMFHHTGDGTNIYTPPENIRNYHLSLGWRDVGYHFMVDYKGIIHEGRPLTMEGAHEEKYNRTAIGIGCIGNFDVEPFPAAMKEALIKLSRKLMKQFNISPENNLLHREVDATACPGRNFPVEEIRAALQGGFSDVPADHWAAKSVARAKELGILDGYKDGTFRGDKPVTRYELADALVSLYERLKG